MINNIQIIKTALRYKVFQVVYSPITETDTLSFIGSVAYYPATKEHLFNQSLFTRLDSTALKQIYELITRLNKKG